MGKLAVYKYIAFMFLSISVLLMLMTFAALIGGYFNPVGNTALAMMVYILPVLVIANAVMLIYWLVRRKWIWSLTSLIPLLCCIPYIGTVYQFRGKPSEAEKGIKVASYNVAMFGRETSGFKAEDILSEMKKQKVDIVCFQEYLDQSGDRKNSDKYKEYFPYMAQGREDMVIYSRYPIQKSKSILFEETNNSAMWADVKVNNKVVRVINAHLETTGFNRTLHQAAKMESNGMQVEENAVVKAIYGNYTLGMIIRAGQAQAVANEQRMSEHPCIVCGDFNDVPCSYVYRTMLGDLVDGFKECGSGWMQTYRGNKNVRIDYIFHDKSMQGISYYKVDLSYSDHYPVFMKIAL